MWWRVPSPDKRCWPSTVYSCTNAPALRCSRAWLHPAAAQALARQAEVAPLELHIDVAVGELRLPDGILYHFELAPGEREMLLTGLDAIARTLELEDQIATFEARDRLARPWAWNF